MIGGVENYDSVNSLMRASSIVLKPLKPVRNAAAKVINAASDYTTN